MASGHELSEPLVTVRTAGPDDACHIARFIRELADSESHKLQLDIDFDRLRQQLEASEPVFTSLLAEVGGEPVGFALFFTSYSSFLTRPSLYLEDLFVLPEHRSHGVGLCLLRAVAAETVKRGCVRLDWCVLDWNAKAIAFYERQGAKILTELRVCRLEGEALSQAAQHQ